MFLFQKLAEKINKSRLCKAYVFLAVFQVVGVLGLLVPTLFNIKQVQENDEDPHKAVKIWIETLTFVLFETWRLVLAFDGIARMNSRTIVASALFTTFSLLFSSMMIIESYKWIQVSYSEIKLVNRTLQITLTCFIFCILFPTFFVMHKITKEFGWEVYKKIGGSVELQRMYNRAQYFSLILKIDIFFEFIFLLLLFAGAIQHQINMFTFVSGSMVPFCLLSIILGRISLSRESHVMMTLFVLSQMLLLAYLVNFIVCSFKYNNGTYLLGWYAYFSFVLCSITASLFTICLALVCQMNFGKDLKDHVQWGFTMKEQKYLKSMDNGSFDKGMDIEPPLKMNNPIDD